jgi:L-ascorbate metabolism protein UlaG (beta-lactamase superfamily)
VPDPADAPAPPFTPDVVAAVVAHMVQDHADDTLAIARGHGAAAGAVAARVTDLGPRGVAIEVAQDDGQTRQVLVPWREVPRDRGAIRTELVRMTEEAAGRRGRGPEPSA